MDYREIIDINRGFQTSVNLEYDLNRLEKIRSYIPTEQSVKVLGEFLKSYYSAEPQKRATVLIGPYGRGKSHLLLVLSALTSLDLYFNNEEKMNEVHNVLYELCDKISSVNKEIGNLAKDIVDSRIRTLPVIVNSNTTDINKALLIAINDALLRSGLNTLMPDTYFDTALEVVDKWEKSFPEAYGKLIEELSKKKIDIESLRLGLNQFDEKSYNLFCECYPKIAAGAKFNPLANMDVIKLYSSINKVLCEKTEYCGINIIFDEFSKFLEANIEKKYMLNFKIIQDLAEAAVRSKENQLHFTCITHKEILYYSTSDSFKTLEGRFFKLFFVASSEQSYELIANAIIKKQGFLKFKKLNKANFEKIASNSLIPNVFSDISQDSYKKNLLYGCYPLTPLSAFVLLHISELVGQNERTLFTFLAQNDKNTLFEFLEKNTEEFSYITVDYIYDYFEELIKKEVFNDKIHSIWAKTDSALRQIDDEVERKILKAIAVINLINDDRLKPVNAHIKALLMLEENDFDKAIKRLEKNHVLSLRESSEYVLLTANGVNVHKTVNNFVKTSLSRINNCEVLTKACDLGFVIPREYNDKFCMTRCFKNIFMDANVFIHCDTAEKILKEFPYDGLIIHIVSKEGNDYNNQIHETISKFKAPQVILCLSKVNFLYEDLLKEYEAINILKYDELSLDPHFLEELELFEEDLVKRIRLIIQDMYSPVSENSIFVNCNGELNINKNVELNHVISHICSQCYSLTPVINNEMVNKRKLNSQNTKARDIVVNWILQNSEKVNIPCLEGNGPEASVYKSVFKRTGLDQSFVVRDNGMNEVLSLIQNFIIESEDNKQSFETIYSLLLKAPYGLRKGIIPMLIAYVLRHYKDSVIIYFKDHEVELSASVLSNLNDNPIDYKLILEKGTQDKSLFLDKLQQLFINYVDKKNTSLNRVYSIVKSMQNWLRALPDYTKKFSLYYENGEIKHVTDQVKVIRDELIKFGINSSELLFNTFFVHLSDKHNFEECYNIIFEVKTFLEEHVDNCRIELIGILKEIFRPKYQGNLSCIVKKWYEKLPEYTKSHIFDSNSNALLSIAKDNNSYNEDELLDSFVEKFISLPIEDWDDSRLESFVKSIKESIKKINDYVEVENKSSENGNLSISIENKMLNKTFSEESITPLGETALNNLKAVFEDYNDSLEPEERLAILAKLIVDIMS